MNKLETRFRHPSWFTEGMTKREALEYFAKSPDFYLVYKDQYPKNGEIRLFEEPLKIPYLKYGGREGGKYRLSSIELDFYLQRKKE